MNQKNLEKIVLISPVLVIVALVVTIGYVALVKNSGLFTRIHQPINNLILALFVLFFAIIILVGFVLYPLKLHKVFNYLKNRHPEKFEQLGRPSVFKMRQFKLYRYILSREGSGDRELDELRFSARNFLITTLAIVTIFITFIFITVRLLSPQTPSSESSSDEQLLKHAQGGSQPKADQPLAGATTSGENC